MKKLLNISANLIAFPLWFIYRSVMFCLLQKTPSYFEFLDNTEQMKSSISLVIFPLFYWLVFLGIQYFFGSFIAWIALASLSFIFLITLAITVSKSLKGRI